MPESYEKDVRHIIVVDIEDISIIKRIKVYVLDLIVSCITLISVSGMARCPTIRLRQ